MARQTQVVKPESIRFGSGKFEVWSESKSDWVNLGAMRGIEFEESWEQTNVESDNAGPIRVRMKDHKAVLRGDLMEIDIENLALIRGGLDKVSEEVGGENSETLAVGTGSWSFNEPIILPHQNWDGTQVEVVSVEEAAGGGDAKYTEGTDYLVVQDRKGATAVIVIEGAGGDASETHNIEISYKYTDLTATRMTSGGYTTINPTQVRVTNYDEEGREFRITVYKAANSAGISIALPSDDADDPMMTPINLEGTCDASRAAGEQLFEIYDAQNV